MDGKMKPRPPLDGIALVGPANRVPTGLPAITEFIKNVCLWFPLEGTCFIQIYTVSIEGAVNIVIH